MNPYAVRPSEGLKKVLSKNAIKSNWEGVIEIYKHDPEAHKAKISRSGDTALHMAVADSQEPEVEQLVSLIVSVDIAALEIENNLGNTPLHLAAYVGSVRMCRCMASRHPKLIGIRNKINETPFFLAVVHGRKEAFLCMHSLCKQKKGYKYGRRNDGRTILHAAISGEHFDLAFQIIHLYDKFQNRNTEQGISPLHILARKPSAFRSGSRLRGLTVKKLKPTDVPSQGRQIEDTAENSRTEKLKPNEIPSQGCQCEDTAENSQTSFSLISRLRNIIWVPKRDRVQKTDAENPNNQQIVHEQAMAPKNYSTRFHGLKLIFKAIRALLGLGTIQIQNIREEKEKHTWSFQIMVELLKNSPPTYEYQYGGSSDPMAPKDGEIAPYTFSEQGIVGYSNEMLPDQNSVVEDDGDQLLQVDDSLEAQQSNKGEQTGRPLVTVMTSCAKIVKATLSLVNDLNNVKFRTGENEISNCCAGKQDKATQTEQPNATKIDKKESPLLIAAKNGIIEMVDKILGTFPVAIHDENIDGKNIVLLAVEYRQPDIYDFLLQRKILKETIFYKTDNKGNSALHIAAMRCDTRNWSISGPALQMQWEIKWYEYVENSMTRKFFVRYNNVKKTPWDIFQDSHKELVQKGSEWLNSTSQSCATVATLIATVAFTASATIPGGVRSDSGTPLLEKEPAFNIFAIASLIALCFSISSVVMFLVFFTSRYHEKDFGTNLPTKLLVELTSLLISIAAVLVSFCAAHFFVVKDNLKYTALPLYAVTCFPVALYAIWQFPTYIDLAVATFSEKPQRIYDYE